MGFMEKGFLSAQPIYSMLTPSPIGVLGRSSKLGATILKVSRVISFVKKIEKNDLATACGELAGSMLISKITRPVKKEITKLTIRSTRSRDGWFRKNGIGGRNWIGPEDAGLDDRIIKKAVLVYHDASKAGRHLDLHIGHLSFVFRLDGKDVIKDIKFNKDGRLTQASKEALVDHLRQEVSKSTRMPQNLDHSMSNARFEWFSKDGPPDGTYGSGKSRQIILNEDVEVVKTSNGPGETLRIYMPWLDKNNQVFIHKLYPGNPTPIAVMGTAENFIPEFNDRLHLKMLGPQDLEKFKSLVDPDSITKKEDGASAHFHITDKQMTLWSPRISKETGKRIEYSSKVPELFKTRSDRWMTGMGELKFKDRWGRDLTSAEIGGILNSDKPRPRGVYPELRVYRVDRMAGTDVSSLSFKENRKIQNELTKLNPFIKVVQRASPKIRSDWEGLVGVPKGKSINDGIKLKFWGDEDDWKVTSIELKNGPTGRTAGVIVCESLTSGKTFNLGPGQIGSEQRVREMMSDPDRFVGQVFKVKSRFGHEGRAAKIIEPHLDKGEI